MDTVINELRKGIYDFVFPFKGTILLKIKSA